MSKPQRKTVKVTAANGAWHKPITHKQYEDLTNEMIVTLNELASPECFDPEFIGAILANAIHSVDFKGGFQTKGKLVDTMIDLIAKRMSFEISEGIRHKKEAEAKARQEAEATSTGVEEATVTPITEAPAH